MLLCRENNIHAKCNWIISVQQVRETGYSKWGGKQHTEEKQFINKTHTHTHTHSYTHTHKIGKRKKTPKLKVPELSSSFMTSPAKWSRSSQRGPYLNVTCCTLIIQLHLACMLFSLQRSINTAIPNFYADVVPSGTIKVYVAWYWVGTVINYRICLTISFRVNWSNI